MFFRQSTFFFNAKRVKNAKKERKKQQQNKNAAATKLSKTEAAAVPAHSQPFERMSWFLLFVVFSVILYLNIGEAEPPRSCPRTEALRGAAKVRTTSARNKDSQGRAASRGTRESCTFSLGSPPPPPLQLAFDLSALSPGRAAAVPK